MSGPTKRAKTKRGGAAPPAKRAKATIAPMETLGRDVLLQLTTYMEPKEALRLSMTSMLMHDAMDDSVWRPMLLGTCEVKPSLLKPRTQTRKMVVNLAQKKSCVLCDRFEPEGCHTIKVYTVHRGKKLCDRCVQLPMFTEIGHMEAMRKYKLKHKELHELPCRLVATTFDISRGESFKTKMYNHQAVLDLVARVRP